MILDNGIPSGRVSFLGFAFGFLSQRACCIGFKVVCWEWRFGVLVFFEFVAPLLGLVGAILALGSKLLVEFTVCQELLRWGQTVFGQFLVKKHTPAMYKGKVRVKAELGRAKQRYTKGIWICDLILVENRDKCLKAVSSIAVLEVASFLWYSSLAYWYLSLNVSFKLKPAGRKWMQVAQGIFGILPVNAVLCSCWLIVCATLANS